MEASGQTLTEFLLSRHSLAANFRKEMFQLLEKWVEAAADARLAAEVNAIREELKHRSVLPFPDGIEQPAPQSERALPLPALDETNHRRRYARATQANKLRKFFKG